MNKKDYKKPELEVIDLKYNVGLLTGSEINGTPNLSGYEEEEPIDI